MRLFLGGSNGLQLFEDDELSRLSIDPVLCLIRPQAGRVVAGTESGAVVLWDGLEARKVAKDLGEGVHTLAVAPNAVLFAGTVPAGLWKSKDGGDTWTELTALGKAPGCEAWTAPGGGTPVATSLASKPGVSTVPVTRDGSGSTWRFPAPTCTRSRSPRPSTIAST